LAWRLRNNSAAKGWIIALIGVMMGKRFATHQLEDTCTV
jgi:hypothetical protein